MDVIASEKNNNQHGKRTAVSKVSTAWACSWQRQQTCGQRAVNSEAGRLVIGSPLSPFSNERAPCRGSNGKGSWVVEGEALQGRRVAIEDQYPDIGKCRQMQHLDQGFRHALSAM